jgi:hypothetical protein
MSISDILSTTLTIFTGTATPSLVTDSFATDANVSISDILSITLSKFIGNTTSSNISYFLATDANMSISDILSTSLSTSTGNTTSSAGSGVLTNATVSLSDALKVIFTPRLSIDNATLSLQFDSLENGTALLDGDQDFIHVNDNSTNNLRSLVIGAWIKPDYSQGSQEFTVISKERSFSLAIDNQISSHEAKFSIFDGIKWTQVDSHYEIPEEWTYLTASFSNQTISIYVNGEHIGTNQLHGVSAISIDGQLESVDIESISSESDIVVGAYITTRDGTHTNNMFSGVIDDVALFDYTLSEVEIRQLYSDGIATHAPAQTDSSDALQAQLSISDALSITLSTFTGNTTSPRTSNFLPTDVNISIFDVLEVIFTPQQSFHHV